MGFLFDPRRKARGAGAPAGHHERDQAAAWSTPCPSPWSRWSTISPSTSAAPTPRCCRGDARADAGRAITRWPCRRCCARNRACFRPRAAPSWSASPPPAAPRRSSPAWCSTCSTTCCRAPRTADCRVARRVSNRCSSATASTACSTSRSRPTCAAAASAWRRTVCPPAAASKTSRPDDVFDAVTDCRARYRETGMEALADGHGGRGHAGRRRGQPLDQGRGRGEGAQPLLPAGRPAPQLHRSRTWPRAGAPAALAGTPLPHVITTSYLTHEPSQTGICAPPATTAIPARCCSRPAAASACA